MKSLVHWPEVDDVGRILPVLLPVSHRARGDCVALPNGYGSSSSIFRYSLNHRA